MTSHNQPPATPAKMETPAGTPTLSLILIDPQPTYIDSSGRWHWPLPERAHFPNCCTSVVTASREWWEYAPAEAKPHPAAAALHYNDKWYWIVDSAALAHSPEGQDAERAGYRKGWDTLATLIRAHFPGFDDKHIIQWADALLAERLDEQWKARCRVLMGDVDKLKRELASRGSEAERLREALRAWEHWYSVDSTEFNRDTAREMGLRALASAAPAKPENAAKEFKPCRSCGCQYPKIREGCHCVCHD